ncbi:hypothetical protein OG455_09245 [Kitasatospora sp. NBC_01287]|uniref:hypothetical protein n=1 Tax=Kitasatospora sp. NBC_01287 TaxID=2903573 RepID=UPI0022551CB5|nr:hypothetical protein [Kitasatospora sp. NBC_01287]MCX4745705.1 hypothetical protein [Kitasatospora sp. NBC_01287]
MTRRRVLTALALALVLVVGGAALTVHLLTEGDLDHGKVFTGASGELTVEPGQLFSIEVDANRVEGDSWDLGAPAAGPAATAAPTPAATPAAAPTAAATPAVVLATGQEYVRNLGITSFAGLTGSFGAGGRYYFVFRARSAGRTTIALHNTYRGGMVPTTGLAPDELDRSFTVTVR